MVMKITMALVMIMKYMAAWNILQLDANATADTSVVNCVYSIRPCG